MAFGIRFCSIKTKHFQIRIGTVCKYKITCVRCLAHHHPALGLNVCLFHWIYLIFCYRYTYINRYHTHATILGKSQSNSNHAFHRPHYRLIKLHFLAAAASAITPSFTTIPPVIYCVLDPRAVFLLPIDTDNKPPHDKYITPGDNIQSIGD